MDESKHCVRTYMSLFVALLFVAGLMTALPTKAIELPSDAWIKGNVSDIDGPVTGSYVKIMMFAAGGVDINWTLTDESGDYEVGVPGGFEYMVVVANESHYMGMEQTYVLAGETAWMNFTLEPIDPLVTDVTIKGFVKDSVGTPMFDGHVLGIVYDDMFGDMPIYANLTVPDGTGYFEVNVIENTAGGGAIAMDFEGYPMIENGTDSPLVAGETYWFNITLELPSVSDDAMLHGRVTVSDSGLPLENVLVSVEVWNESMGEGYSNYTFTDEDGYYQMNVSSGDGRMIVMKGGYTNAMFEIEIGEGAVVQQDAELTPTNCIVKGNVTDGTTSDPLPSVTVFIWYGFDQFSLGSTNQDGYYELRCVDGEGLFMTLETDGYSRGFAQIDLLPGEQKWQDFELWPVTAWIEGNVTDFFDGTPIVDAVVSIDSEYYRTDDYTNASGYYRLEVPPGVHEVEVWHWDYRENVTSVEAFDGAGTTHDVALLPWDLPLDRKFHGWVNDSVSGFGIFNAAVKVQLQDGTYSNETRSDLDGYYEMYVPAVKLDYLVTAYQHYPAQGVLDPTASLQPRMDFLLDRDQYPPNITYDQSPVENVSWLNPTVISAEVEEPNLERLMLMQCMFMEMDGDWEVFLVVDMKSTSFNPLEPDDQLHYVMNGDNYTVHEEWNATVPSGGWLDDGIDSHYITAYEQWWGPESFYVTWGYYSNSTLTNVSGSAYFDVDTGELMWFWLDWEGQVYPGDPTASFSPQVLTMSFDTVMWTGWPMMNWTILDPFVADDMVFTLNEEVPSGLYRTLFIASDFGGQADIALTNVTVDNEPPVANAGPDRTEVVNTSIELNGSLSSDNGWIESYVWEFDDNGTPVTLTGEVVTYMFTVLGSYAVNLTVTDGAGHQDMHMIWVDVVDDMPPVADAGEDFEVDEDVEAIFDGSGSTDDVEIVNYTWTVVDYSEELYGVGPTYTFDVPGEYEVTLVVEDYLGQVSSPDSVIVAVNDTTAPVADAGPDVEASLGLAMSFDGSGSTDNVAIASYTWSFTDDGEDVELYGESPSYTFGSLGEYVVTLTVEDAAGHSDTDEVIVTVVDNTAPVADAGPDQAVAVDEEVEFNGTGSTDNVEITSYTWTFNDGTNDVTLSGPTPVFTFDEYGAYVVTLTVEDAAGNDDTDTVTIRVSAPPVADAGPDMTATVGKPVTFDGSGSTGDIESYVWIFVYDGEEQELTGESPTFTFEIVDEYVVTLEVTDTDGLTDTDTVVVTVEEDGGAAEDKSFLEEYWWVLAIVAIIVVVAAASMAMMKSGKGKGGVPEGESRDEASDDGIPPPPDDGPL
ncbi:MAG: PKD domain-containing protein [Methanobacteriota archaeon]|nr:MAG: PKD domain-containing protein [Euryarchaeota archaeon]